MMNLKDFPRPPRDNGRGMHFDLDVRQDKLDAHLPMLREMGVTWAVFYVGDELQTARCVQGALAYGIMPIVRPKVKVDGICNWDAIVSAARQPGILQPYIQIFNEVGNPDEWNTHHPDLNVFAARWKDAARRVVAEGGLPGLQAMDRSEVVAALSDLEPEVKDKVWFASHAYASNHPPNYPYDARNQQDHPGVTVFDDETCALGWMKHASWCKEELGFFPPVIVTEGGCVMDQLEDNRYPRTDADLHVRYTVEIFEQFRGVLANGDPLPDYFFAYCPFIFYDPDYYSFSWLQVASQTIDAVKAMPLFERLSSWDMVEPPDDLWLKNAAQNAALAHKPWMPINDQAALYKFAQKSNLGYPQTDEYDFWHEGATYVGQVFNLGIVYVKKGDWQNCKWVPKPQEKP